MDGLSRAAKAMNGEDPDAAPPIVPGVTCWCCGESAHRNCVSMGKPGCEPCVLAKMGDAAALLFGDMLFGSHVPVPEAAVDGPCPRHREVARDATGE